MEIDYSLPFRRTYKRFIVEVQATLIINNSLRITAIAKDLCSRGVGIICKYPLKVNEQVEIIIFLALQNTVCNKAKVVWSEKVDENLWRAGLDFGLDNLTNLPF